MGDYYVYFESARDLSFRFPICTNTDVLYKFLSKFESSSVKFFYKFLS